MHRAVGIELADGRRFFVYEGKDHEVAVAAVVSSQGGHRLWSVNFFGGEGDEDGRQHFGRIGAFSRVYVYHDSAIVELDMGRPVLPAGTVAEGPFGRKLP